MGNRAIVKFIDATDTIGHAVYQHWNAGDVTEWLAEAAPLMRRGDASYAAARWAAHLCGKFPEGLSVGLVRGELADDPENGLYVVDCSTGKVRLYHETIDGTLRQDPGVKLTLPMGQF